MKADTSQSLETIRNETRVPIASALLDIQKRRDFNIKSRNWVSHLKCLDLSRSQPRDDDRKFLWRGCVNALENGNYIAVSYVWDPPEDPQPSHGKYLVKARGKLISSKVRDQVLDRVIKYTTYCRNRYGNEDPRIEGFWIDQDCINQENPAEKELAMQSMEYVYSQSKFPVGLLSVCIKSVDDLEALIDLLEGTERRLRTFHLLKHLTSDSWWQRAWTFQEDYHASTRMVLLIRHDLPLEKQKREVYRLFGGLQGEICIESVKFREKVTEFCRGYQPKCQQDEADRQEILRRAGKYTIQLQETDKNGGSIIRRAMSPIIFSDVGSRGITKESDRLAIIANCCRYSVRLNATKLHAKNCSLSLAMLCLFLLNGEICMGTEQGDPNPLRSTIFQFLSEQSLRTFQPHSVREKLTFIKSCRFPNVRFSEQGIDVAGHLWMLCKIVENPVRTRPPINGPGYMLNRYQRKRLRQLAHYFESGDCGKRYQSIADELNRYLNEDIDRKSYPVTFSKKYKDLMAKEVVGVTRTPRELRLARLIPAGIDQRAYTPYRGIFVKSDDFQWSEQKISFVFTASHPANDNHPLPLF
jgi:hypothetical protein